MVKSITQGAYVTSSLLTPLSTFATPKGLRSGSSEEPVSLELGEIDLQSKIGSSTDFVYALKKRPSLVFTLRSIHRRQKRYLWEASDLP